MHSRLILVFKVPDVCLSASVKVDVKYEREKKKMKYSDESLLSKLPLLSIVPLEVTNRPRRHVPLECQPKIRRLLLFLMMIILRSNWKHLVHLYSICNPSVYFYPLFFVYMFLYTVDKAIIYIHGLKGKKRTLSRSTLDSTNNALCVRGSIRFVFNPHHSRRPRVTIRPALGRLLSSVLLIKIHT